MMRNAGVAQLVERFIRNEKVGGSIPFSGTRFIVKMAISTMTNDATEMVKP